MTMRKLKAHIFAKEAHGHYVEPPWTTRRLLEVEAFDRSLPIYDPACGWGTILKEAAAKGFVVMGSDVVNRRRHKLNGAFHKQDFLQMITMPPCSIICNPPFHHVEEFCRQALALGARKVAMITLVRRLNAARWLQEMPLTSVHLLTPRPSMPPGSWIAAGGKPGGGTQDFCWLVFRRGYSGAPALRWLHRDKS